MKKIYLLTFVLVFAIISINYAQKTSDLTAAKAEIKKLINIQNDSLKKHDKKKIEILFNLTIDEKNNNERIEFSFGSLRIFRFYIYTLKGKTRFRLWQTKDGPYRHQETEKVLFGFTDDSNNKEVSYYDYTKDERNDFAIELESVGKESAIAAVYMVQIIDNGKRYFYPKDKKCVIIIKNEGAENDTITRYY